MVSRERPKRVRKVTMVKRKRRTICVIVGPRYCGVQQNLDWDETLFREGMMGKGKKGKQMREGTTYTRKQTLLPQGIEPEPDEVLEVNECCGGEEEEADEVWHGAVRDTICYGCKKETRIM